MKSNIFNFKKIKENKIILEEEKTTNPFLLFFKSNRNLIIFIFFLIILIMITLSIYYIVKNTQEGIKVVTNINNVVVDFESTNEINSVNMKPISGGVALKEFYSRYGNIGLTEGVIFKVKELDTKNGHIIYYSDYSSILIKTNNTIVRVSSLDNKEYGIRESDGSIILGAKTKELTITKQITLNDNTIIIYYSDNSARIINTTDSDLLVRNSANIIIKNNKLITINPSGIAKESKENKNNQTIIYYEDGTIKINNNNDTYIIRSTEDIDIDKLTFPNNNQATITETISLKDLSKIIYYSDGSAEYINSKNISLMIRKSKDIIYDENRVIEVIDTKYATKASEKKSNNNIEITYLTNAGALILYPNGTYGYVYENSNIKYDKNNNMQSENIILEKEHKYLPDKTLVIDLNDNNSIIINNIGYRVVETNKIIYDKDGNIKGILDEDDITDNNNSISNNNFTIENKGNDDIKYLITIEVSDNYKKYASIKLDPSYLRYNMVINTTYLEKKTLTNKLPIGTILENDTKITKETYILYEGILESNKSIDVSLGLWLDYTDITNEYQDSVFVGTIIVYSESIKE